MQSDIWRSLHFALIFYRPFCQNILANLNIMKKNFKLDIIYHNLY